MCQILFVFFHCQTSFNMKENRLFMCLWKTFIWSQSICSYSKRKISSYISSYRFVWNFYNHTLTRYTRNICWSYRSVSFPQKSLFRNLKFHLDLRRLDSLALALALGFAFALPRALPLLTDCPWPFLYYPRPACIWMFQCHQYCNQPHRPHFRGDLLCHFQRKK